MKAKRFTRLFDNILPILNDHSVLAGFLLAFSLFFIRPVFFGPKQIMEFFVYVPIADPIGLDLNQMLSYCESFFVHHGSPYIGNNLYPPLATIFFGPLLMLDKPVAYGVITVFSLFAYILTTLVIPLLVYRRNKQPSVIYLLFVAGLFSYGLHFELERGQFNLIAFAFALFAVYLFHFKPRFRLLSYVLLSVSIQLKIFPIIFLIMMVDDWMDWKNNAKTFLKIIFINISLLFVLGYQVFQDFIQAISKQALNPHIIMTNHSIKVFVELITRKAGYRVLFLDRGVELSQIKVLAEYSNVAQLLLQMFAVGCLLTILLRSIKMKSGGFDPFLVASCTILMLLLPSVSNDYKLPLIMGPLSIAFQDYPKPGENPKLTLGFVFLAFIGSFVLSSTLFSYTNKPLIFDNNAPNLLILLLVLTIMSMISDRRLALRDESV